VSGHLPIFGLVFAIALIITAGVTPLARRSGLRLALVDRPGGRRQHAGAVSRLGGIALYVGFTVAVLATLFLPAGWFPPRLDPQEMTRMTGLLAGTGLIFLFGLLDDRYQFSSWPQYLAQFLSCFIAIGAVIFIERVNSPFGGVQIVFPWPIVWILTIFWFMGMMNTVNWLDGLDGLAAGVAAIMSAFLAIHMIREGQFSVALLPVALLGATLGFLPFNINPARVFMGSSGSYFLGWALAALGIIGGAKVATVLLVMGLPILDVAWLIFYRWRRGGKVSAGGRDHLHYRLLDLGFSQRQIVLGYYAWCVAFGALALWLENRLYKLIALLVLGAVALTVVIWASRRSPAGSTEKPGLGD
jgi:UDP-GlcNAc:undecaprenyl-phosphate GlcNAc-1-phosphate transferase